MDISDFLINPVQALNQLTGFVQSVLNKYVVRLGNNSVGIGGFIFDVLSAEEVSLDAEITDHYVEENYAIQDHVALRAERVTLRGYVGELTDSLPQALLSIISTIDRLGILDEILPNFTEQALEVYLRIQNSIGQASSVIQQAGNLYDLFNLLSSSSSLPQQSNIFNYFYSLWGSRQTFSVQTPYGVIDNMVIENVRALQPEESRYRSDFSVTFKKLRTAKTAIVLGSTPVVSSIFSERAWQMIASIRDFGIEQGTDLPAGARITYPSDYDEVENGIEVLA